MNASPATKKIRYGLILFHLTAFAVLNKATWLRGDLIDFAMLVVCAIAAFFYHRRHPDFATGLLCFCLYIYLLNALDRLGNYPLYSATAEEELLDTLRLLLVYLTTFGAAVIALGAILNPMRSRRLDKRRLLFSLLGLLLLHSRILALPGSAIRQLWALQRIDLNSIEIDDHWNESFTWLVAKDESDIFFTKVLPSEIYAITRNREGHEHALFFEKDETTGKYRLAGMRTFISVHHQVPAAAPWERALFSHKVKSALR